MITIESAKQQEEARGYKGELRSLAGLRSLLGSKPVEPEQPPAPSSPG